MQFGVIARNFSSSAAVQNAIKNVTVIGGGLMGSGIAQVRTSNTHYRPQKYYTKSVTPTSTIIFPIIAERQFI